MPTRQREWPRQWLIVDRPPGEPAWRAIRSLRRGSGVILLVPLHPRGRRRIRNIAGHRQLAVVAEHPRAAARVHNQRELTRTMLKRAPLILVSPVYETASHPDWNPLPRMRAAALARLTGRRAIALGGMNRERYAKIASLGFIGWAGISAFRT
jgi:thiamine-phosphate pyrophosphorylase